MIPRRSVYRRDTGSPQGDDGHVNRGVDSETLEFIQKYLTSYTKWEILKYFGDNPEGVETPRGFARRLGKDIRQISEALKSLARTGIIGNGRGSDEAGYSLTAEESQRTTLLKIAASARTNNRFRLLLNYHITKASLAKYRTDRP